MFSNLGLMLRLKKSGFLLVLRRCIMKIKPLLDLLTFVRVTIAAMATTGSTIRSKEMGHIMQSGHGGRASLLSLFEMISDMKSLFRLVPYLYRGKKILLPQNIKYLTDRQTPFERRFPTSNEHLQQLRQK